MCLYGDFETFLHDVGEERIFQMLVYRKLYTPYEIKRGNMDESVYENNTYIDVKIRETIIMPNDILLGVQYMYDDSDFDIENPPIVYHRLGDILLSYNPEREKEILQSYEGDNNGN